jgi:hypothetical protein
MMTFCIVRPQESLTLNFETLAISWNAKGEFLRTELGYRCSTHFSKKVTLFLDLKFFFRIPKYIHTDGFFHVPKNVYTDGNSMISIVISVIFFWNPRK